MAAWEWPGTLITAVIDGDSIDAVITRDLGFGGKAVWPVRVRLARINARPAKTVNGRLATARVRELTTGHTVDMVTVRRYKYGGPEDTLGEIVAEVTLPDGQDLSDLLVAEGLAVYWDGTGPRPDGPPDSPTAVSTPA